MRQAFFEHQECKKIPYFRQKFPIVPGIPGIVGEPCEEEAHDCLDEGEAGEDGPAPHPVPLPHDGAAESREKALEIEHMLMTHMPKNSPCDICNRARMYQKRT